MALYEVPAKLSVLASRFGDQDMRYLIMALAFAFAMGTLLVLVIGLMLGLGLSKAGFVVRRKRPAMVVGDTASQTTGTGDGGQPVMANVEQIYWLEPSGPRNCWHLDPRCNGFHSRRERVVGHRACRICAHGIVKTEADGYAFE